MQVQNTNQQENKAVPAQKIKKQPRYASYWRCMAIAINLSLSNFYFGYCLAYISTIQFSRIIQVFNVNMPLQTATGVITGCISIGALFGALAGKKLIHWFSRRNFILFINALAIVAGSLIYIQNVACLIIMRLIQGACIGMYTSIVPIVIAQISPIQITGTTGAFTQMFCSVGTTIAYLFYYILYLTFDPAYAHNIWYFVFGFPMIALVVQSLLLLFVFPYETPKYFLMHHQKSKARDLIAEIYKPEYVEEVLNQKIRDLALALQKQKKLKQSKLRASVERPNRVPSKVSVNSALSGIESQQPENAPLSTFTSLHLNTLRQLVGINAVVAYGGNIIKQAAPVLRPIAPIILNFLAILGAAFSTVLLVKFGRRALLQAGTFILTITLLLITVGFFILGQAYTAGLVLIVVGLLVYMFTFGATLGSIIWLYIAQICEPSYTIIATVVTWIFAALIIVFFPILTNLLPGKNPSYLFLIFLIWTGLSFVVNHFVLIETKGKTGAQIQEEFRNLKLCGNSASAQVAPGDQKKDVDHSMHEIHHTDHADHGGHHDETSASVIKVNTHHHNLQPMPPILQQAKF